MSPRRRRVRTAIEVLLVLALAATAAVAVAQPAVVVGPPAAKVRGLSVLGKPDPPKAAAARPTGKPPAIDLLAGPLPVTAAPPGDPVAAAVEQPLLAALQEAGDAGTSAISVIDADGRIVFDRGGDVPLLPASTLKLVTAAAALTAFGPDHTFTTTVTTSAPIDAGGVVTGDLLLLGGADPTLVSPAWVEAGIDPDRPQTHLAALADQVVAAGITAVDGAVLGVPGYLQGEPLATGWPIRYLEDGDATPITGLTIDEGLDVSTDEGGRVRATVSTDPVRAAAVALAAALTDRGITVAGGGLGVPADVVDPTTVRQVEQGVLPRLGSVSSPPLLQILRTMVRESDNHMADTLDRVMGRLAEGEGSFPDGGSQQVRVLGDLGIDWTTTVLADGSGLSRDNRIPTRVLTALGYLMARSSAAATWEDLMAVTGESGTLRRRLVDTIAEGRLRGKTGSLGDVRALSGAVVGPDGRSLYFSVVSNDLDGPQVASARRLQDLVVLRLTAALHGCSELPPTPDAPLEGDLPPLPTHDCG